MKFVCNFFQAALLASILLFLLPLLPVACVPNSGSQDNMRNAYPVQSGGLLSLFLNLKDAHGLNLTMGVTSIDVLSDNGSWEPVLSRTVDIRSGVIKKGQKFLGRAALPPGSYSRLRFHLGAAAVNKPDGKQLPLSLSQTSLEMNLVHSLIVRKGDSKSLFLIWDTKASLSNNILTPVVTVAPKLKHMIVDIAYVACPDINTVFMVRTDKNQVYDSMAVQDGPMYVFKNPRDNDMVYALARWKASVRAISPSANKVVAEYNLPMAGEATYMALSPDGAYGYVIDRQRGYIIKMDMVSGTIIKRQYLGYNPSYIIYLEKYNRLAVSLNLSQTVVILDAEMLNTVQQISTGNSPEGLLNWDGTFLYIAESGSNSVLVYDLERSREIRRIPVEFNPERLMYGNNYIYVTNYGSGSISLLKPGQMGAVRIVPLSGRPLELARVIKSKWIYVGDESADAITVLDADTTREVTLIELGAKPMGMVVLE